MSSQYLVLTHPTLGAAEFGYHHAGGSPFGIFRIDEDFESHALNRDEMETLLAVLARPEIAGRLEEKCPGMVDEWARQLQGFILTGTSQVTF